MALSTTDFVVDIEIIPSQMEIKMTEFDYLNGDSPLYDDHPPLIKKAKITATPCNGVHMPLEQFKEVREITHDLPADVIGECVTQAVHNAWKAGFDPAINPFLVIVTFE